MNRYLALSGGLHTLALILMLAFLAPSAKKANATYTIDFIGTSKVIATTGQEMATPKAPEQTQVATPKPEEKPAPAPKAPEKTTKKAYAAKAEIAAKPKPKKAKEKEVPLATPSVLAEEDDTEDLTPSVTKEGQEGKEQPNAFGGGNIQTDFADFPYPWYITQVRNGLWSEWEKRRPVGSTLGTMVSFAISRDGKIKDLKVEKKSGDDTFDFAATSAVINAGPFAPLPMYYEKDELTVTVEFKQES